MLREIWKPSLRKQGRLGSWVLPIGYALMSENGCTCLFQLGQGLRKEQGDSRRRIAQPVKKQQDLVRSVEECNCWRASCILLRHSTCPVTFIDTPVHISGYSVIIQYHDLMMISNTGALLRSFQRLEMLKDKEVESSLEFYNYNVHRHLVNWSVTALFP